MTGLGGNNWNVTVNADNQLSNLTYDSAGEVTRDQYGNQFSYDAEGRILSAGIGTYVYDGDGNRVKKTASGTTTLYWPGAGSLLDESNSSGSAMGSQVWFDGLLVWHEDTSGSGLFLFPDQLGSIRITGDASGTEHDDNDYESFGTLYNNYGSSPSDNHYLFTGYESDSETTSDYAAYRNLGMTLGRFNRPDPYDGSYDQTNPQSLNRYSYALNNPLLYVDPSGLDDGPNNGGSPDPSCTDGTNCDIQWSLYGYNFTAVPLIILNADCGVGCFDLGAYSNWIFENAYFPSYSPYFAGPSGLPSAGHAVGSGAPNSQTPKPATPQQKRPCSQIERLSYAWHGVETVGMVGVGAGLAVTGVAGGIAACTMGSPLLCVAALPGAAAAVYDGYKITTSSWNALQTPNNPEFGADCQ